MGVVLGEDVVRSVKEAKPVWVIDPPLLGGIMKLGSISAHRLFLIMETIPYDTTQLLIGISPA